MNKAKTFIMYIIISADCKIKLHSCIKQQFSFRTNTNVKANGSVHYWVGWNDSKKNPKKRKKTKRSEEELKILV